MSAFETANIEELPFEDGRFDVVVANHMLYHVPNLEKGLGQVRRVLKENGRFYAATNGQTHMQELRQLGEEHFPDAIQTIVGSRLRQWVLAFRLENGRSLLEPFFQDITLHLYEDSLAVTEVEPLLAYVSSSTQARQTITEEIANQIRQHVAAEIATKGAFHVTKSTGLFVAQR